MLLSRLPLRSLLTLLIFGVGLVSPTLAQDPARTVSGTVSLATDGEVTINNHEGSITVTTWGRDRVRYEAEIMPTDEDPNAEKVTIQSRVTNERFRLVTTHEEGDDESVVFGFDEDGFRWGGIDIPAVHYTVRMPRTAALRIDDHESTINVTGLAARLQIDTHESPITVEKQRGEVVIDSYESRISVTDQEGDVTFNTHEGRMKLHRVVGRLEVDTHEGDLTAEGLKGGLRFEAHDGTADVSFASLTSDVFASTHDGDVTLSLPSETGFHLGTDFDEDADLDSDFDLRSIRIADEDEDDKVSYRGDVHGDGPEIYLESQDGDFVIRAAEPSPSDSSSSSTQ
jgi:DUF4097 and DUF4098 domain-containing protein YvlB